MSDPSYHSLSEEDIQSLFGEQQQKFHQNRRIIPSEPTPPAKPAQPAPPQPVLKPQSQSKPDDSVPVIIEFKPSPKEETEKDSKNTLKVEDKPMVKPILKDKPESKSLPFWAKKPEPQPKKDTIAAEKPHFRPTTYPVNASPNIFKIIAKFIGVFALIFAISFTVVNGPALILKLKYFWEVDYKNQPWGTNYSPLLAGTIPVQESRLVIPKLNIDAPIFWNVASDDIVKTLESGIAHYEGTALPGQAGNVFLTGHSSYYWWSGGSYKQIFALLDKLNAGDKIYLYYQGNLFTYQVEDLKVVSPDNMSVLEPLSGNNLSLMTCVPVGTNLQRLVVIAKQVAY